MHKAVYSLVLSEDVVEAVDRMAYARGTSRSNLINQILAQAVGYVTPEQRMAEILETLTAQMGGLYQLQAQASDGMLTIRSPLRYRYKPTIRYRVELYRQPRHALGLLHASFRTQSRALLEDANAFFTLWSQLELAAGICDAADIHYGDGTWTRAFIMPAAHAQDTRSVGEAMSRYIKRVDGALKRYFAALPDETNAAAQVRAAFAEPESEKGDAQL